MRGRGSIFKIWRCDCGKLNRQVKSPEKTPPPCPLCNGSTYYFDMWYISCAATGSRPQAVSTSKEIAIKRLNTLLGTPENEKTQLESDSRLTWTEATALYYTYLESLKDVTAGFYRQRVETFLTPFFYEFSVKTDTHLPPQLAKRIPEHINDLLPQHLDAFMIYCRKVLNHSNSTINRARTTLNNMINVLVKGRILRPDGGRYLSYNQLATVPALPENDSREAFFYNDAEIKALLKEAAEFDRRLPVMIGLGCYGGLRRRTIVEMRKDYIHLDRTMIAIPASSRKRGKYTHHVKIVPQLEKLLVEYMSNLSSEEKESEWLFCGEKKGLRSGVGKDHISFSRFDALFQKLKRKVTVDGLVKAGKRFHDTKHTAGTYMFAASGDILKTASFLDHADVNQSRKYIGILDGADQENMDKFSKLLS